MRPFRLAPRSCRYLAALALAFPALSACAAAQDAVLGPKMSAMSYPAPLVAAEQPVILPAGDGSGRMSANSLWRVGARTFFGDQRAGKVGDILTVAITIDDNASVTNGTTRERKSASSMGVPHFFGLESSLGKILPSAFSASNAMQTNSDNQLTGTGQINRQDKINLTIAAVVTKVLPNGNLVIQGKQEVKTNNELRELTVAGVVRPEDISSANTINHTQIAEARISYGGRGDLARTNTTPYGQAIAETFSPF
ncbi:MAG: flagellar basal body L-ring protein FlgH [Caulobacteraceae bacterium]